FTCNWLISYLSASWVVDADAFDPAVAQAVISAAARSRPSMVSRFISAPSRRGVQKHRRAPPSLSSAYLTPDVRPATGGFLASLQWYHHKPQTAAGAPSP